MSNKLVSHTLTCNNQIVKSYWKVLLCKMLYKDEYNSCMVTLKWKRKEKSIFTELNLNIKHSKVCAALSINFPWFQILSVHIHVCAHTHKNLFHLCLEIHIFCWDAGLGVMVYVPSSVHHHAEIRIQALLGNEINSCFV